MVKKSNKARVKQVVIPDNVVKKALTVRCDDEEGIEFLEKILMKLPFCNDGDVSMERLEKVLRKYEYKYDLLLGYIMRYKPKNKKDRHEIFHYSLMLKNEAGEWLETVYAVTVWEGFAKLLIFIYKYVQDGCKGGRTSSDIYR